MKRGPRLSIVGRPFDWLLNNGYIGIAGHLAVSRKRTAARMRILRAQLREADWILDAYNYTTPLTGQYLEDVKGRRRAVQEARGL